jgi:uncharacterized protein (TIGR00730 family)
MSAAARQDATRREHRGKRPIFCLDPDEFQSDPTWHLDDIMREFVEGFRFLLPLKKEVTFFGSARISSSSPWYAEANRLAGLLAERGYTIVTGGGPGIMEAANMGAHAKCLPSHRECSVGIDIVLAEGVERKNPYIDHRMAFHYFFTRKVMLSASAQAYIFFPGGFGTLDEFTEILTLVQTKKMEPVPMVCVGRAFWEPFQEWMRTAMLKLGEAMIQEVDLSLFKIVDTAEDALAVVETSKERKFF